MLTEASVNLLQSYQAGLTSYDEVLDTNGKWKPHWQALFATLEKLGIEELKSRNTEIISKLRENGVTYNVYGSPDGMNRPWQLDPIPFLIEQKEWNGIAKGLQQRAILMDMVRTWERLAIQAAHERTTVTADQMAFSFTTAS